MLTNPDLPLTPIQCGMGIYQFVAPRSGVDIEPIVVTLQKPGGAYRLRDAWCRVVAQHCTPGRKCGDARTTRGFIDWLRGRDPAPPIVCWRNLRSDIGQAAPFPAAGAKTAARTMAPE